MSTNHTRQRLLDLLQATFGPRVTVSEFHHNGVDYLITDGPASYPGNLFTYRQDMIAEASLRGMLHRYDHFSQMVLPIGMMHRDVAIAIAEELGINIRYLVADPADLSGPRVTAFVLTAEEFQAAVARGFGA